MTQEPAAEKVLMQVAGPGDAGLDRGYDARAVIAAGWSEAGWAEQVAFRSWVESYAATPVAERGELASEGVVLAKARRTALKALIVTDPEAALAAAVPLAVRAGLPAEVVEQLETRISGSGELSVNAVTPMVGGERPLEPEFRSALVGGVEYRAHVYGKRAKRATLAESVMVGIAVDREFAVADSPVRLFEAGEEAPRVVSAPVTATMNGADCAACAARAYARAGSVPAAGEVAYEYAGRVGVAENAEHFAADAAKLEGLEKDNTAADNQPGTSTVVGRPAQAWTHGNKTVLVIRVDFPDFPGAPANDDGAFSESDIVDLFVNGGVGTFFAESSFGKTNLSIRAAVAGDSPDVTEVFRLSRTGSSYATAGDTSSLHSDARAAAAAAGYDVDAYDRVGVFFTNLRSEPGSKLKFGGLANVIGKNFWINGAFDFRVTTHELGHTYGLRHANLWQVADGNPVSDAGESVEYGDPFDIMGGGEFFSSLEDFSPWNKSILQWIPDTAVMVADAGGTFRVHRFDAPAANLALPRALKVVRDPVRDYWIGYRRATDSASLDGGAYVMWGYNANQQSDLLDLTTPGTNPEDAALAIGRTFNDAEAGVMIKPVAQGGSGADEWLDVEVTLLPRLQWVESTVSAGEQLGTANLVLRRSANSQGELSVTYATEALAVSNAATATTDYTVSSGTVTWADGDMTDKTVTIGLVSDGIVEAAESFGVRLGTVTGGVRVGDSLAVVTIADPGSRDPGFKADFINSSVQTILPMPDGSVLLGGYFFLAQSSGVLSDRSGLLKLSSTGILDTEFDPGEGVDATPVRALALQPDGRVLVAGDFQKFAGVSRSRIARLNIDGSLDTSFDPGVGADGAIHAVVLLPDGRILAGGAFKNFDGVAREYLVQLMPDGSVDPTFVGPDFGDSAASWRVECLALQENGRVLVGGSFFFKGSKFKSGLCRILSSGALDPDFSDLSEGAHAAGSVNTISTVRTVAVRPNGRILVGGDFTGFNGVNQRRIAQLTSSGAFDSSFNPGVGLGAASGESVNALLLLPGGQVVAAGRFTGVNGELINRLAQLEENGTLNTAFSAGGSPAGSQLDLALGADGRLYIAGAVNTFQTAASEIHPVWRVFPGLGGSAGVVDFSADAYSGLEGGNVTLTVRRTGGSLGAIRVGYAAARGHASDTATVGQDYTLASGVLAWADGDAEPKTITIPLATDAADDNGETFTMRIGEPLIGGVFLGERREAVVTISPDVLQIQSITFAALPDRGFVSTPIPLVATASSELQVSFSVVSGPATISGGALLLNGLGEVTVQASQPGDPAFSPANPVERSFLVTQGTQTIAFPQPPNRTVSAGALDLSASATSGLPVSFELVAGAATLSGARLTPSAVGEVTVRAVQAGNANFQAAAAVERTFNITLAATVSLGGLTQTYGDTPRSVTVTTTPPGLGVTVTYDGSTTPPTEAGSYAVVASILDDEYSGVASGTLVIAKATLQARARTTSMIFKGAVPPLAVDYVGLAGDDSAADIDVQPTLATTANNKSKLGSYPITVSGGSDDNYTLVPQNGVLNVVTISGVYETLLFEGEDPSATGWLRLTVAGDQKVFTGVLEWADEAQKLTVRGTVASASGSPDDVIGEGSLLVKPKGAANYTYRLVVKPGAVFTAELYRNNVLIGAGTGGAILPATDKTRGGFAGAYTLRFSDFAADNEADARTIPTGSGLATATVAKNGPLKLAGTLPDGKKLAGLLPVSAARDGDYLFFARPYGARTQSYVAGRLQTRRAGVAAPELVEPGVPFVWRKGVKPANIKSELFADGFALSGASELRRWTAPTPAVTLPVRLGLDSGDAGVLAVEYAGADLGEAQDGLPVAVAMDAKGAISVSGANAFKLLMKITPTNGSFAGTFDLRDAVPVTGKPDKIVVRKVKFSGVLRQPDANATGESDEAKALVGEATYLVPPLVTGGATESGSLELRQPPDVP